MKLPTDALSLLLASHSASDPLTQFACAFSALIHDVDHVGVSNAHLAKEEVPIAGRHKAKPQLQLSMSFKPVTSFTPCSVDMSATNGIIISLKSHVLPVFTEKWKSTQQTVGTTESLDSLISTLSH